MGRGEEGEMSEDRLGEGGGGESLHITKKEEFSLDRLELLKTVGTGGFCFTSHSSSGSLSILVESRFYWIRPASEV